MAVYKREDKAVFLYQSSKLLHSQSWTQPNNVKIIPSNGIITSVISPSPDYKSFAPEY
jgi:hypothetical protein